MNISYIKNTTPLNFQRKKTEQHTNTVSNPNNNSKDSVLLGALLALASLSYPTVDTKAAEEFDYNEFQTEYIQNTDDITPTRNITAKFNQGCDVGNCVGVATLHAFARSEEGLDYLNSLVSKDSNNDFVVTFPNKEPITIKKSIIDKYKAVIGNDYAEAITFALYKDAGNLDDNGNMKQGQKTHPASISLHDRATYIRLSGVEPNCSSGSLKDLKKIESSLNDGKKLLITTCFKEGVEGVTNHKAFPKHEFTLTGVDLENDEITVTNPWYHDDSYAIKMSVEDYQKYNGGMNILLMNTDNNKFSFSNPDIGTKPGEVDYDIYFDIINYKPTLEDYNKYFSQDKYKKGESNEFTLSFWSQFDEEGYDYFVDKKNKRISQTEIAENMPVYSALRKEGYTPISMVKQYMKTGKVPNFRNKELQGKREDIKNWLQEHEKYITYAVQIDHYGITQKELEEKKRAEIEAKKKAEEAAKQAAEAEKLRQIEQYNNMIVDSLKHETFNSNPVRAEKGVFPNDLAEHRKLFPEHKPVIDAKGNKIIRYRDLLGETNILKFDKNGHILSKDTKDKNGKVVEYEKYTYSDDGSRMCEKKSRYGTCTEQEIFDGKGNLIAYNMYSEDKNVSKRTTYITAPDGKLLKASFVCKSLENSKKYFISTSFDEESKYEFNADGSVKKEFQYTMETKNGKRQPKNIRTTEYIDSNNSKIYWNGELKVIEKNGKSYDVNGNELKSYVLSWLPSAKEDAE